MIEFGFKRYMKKFHSRKEIYGYVEDGSLGHTKIVVVYAFAKEEDGEVISSKTIFYNTKHYNRHEKY